MGIEFKLLTELSASARLKFYLDVLTQFKLIFGLFFNWLLFTLPVRRENTNNSILLSVRETVYFTLGWLP